MKINNYWLLSIYHAKKGRFYPVKTLSPSEYTEIEYKNFDHYFKDCTIIHYPHLLGFRPIVLKGNKVWGAACYDIRIFLDDVNKCIHNIDLRKTKRKTHYYYFRRLKNYKVPICKRRIEWGCREFTYEQLITIRDAIIWHMNN